MDRKVYIAGKITGLDEAIASAAFASASDKVRSLGLIPLNPMEMVDQTPGRSYSEYLRDAVRILVNEADAVAFIPGWCDSYGAKVEHRLAIDLKLPIFYMPSDTAE